MVKEKLMSSLKKTYSKYKVMIDNFSYLTLLKGLTLILPLITFPYLIQTLGAKNYGLVMWVWAISEMLIVFIKFGFDTLGVKLISENRNYKEKVSEVFSQIMYVKIGLLLFSISMLITLIIFLDKFYLYQNLFIYFSFFILFESMLPIWYFQGIENMKIMAILVSSIKLIFALLVFIVIKDESQYFYIPILYTIGSFLANLVAYYIILYKHEISFVKIKIDETLSMTKESFFIFFATFGTVIRDKGTIILIEKYLGLESVAYFDLAMKIVNILLTPFHIISQVIYPHIAKTKDVFLFKKVLSLSLFISIIVGAIFIINIDQIVILLDGKLNKELKNILKILIFIVPIGLISSFLGGSFLIVFNNSKWIAISIIYATLAYLILFLIYNLLISMTLVSFAYLFIIFYFVEMIVRIYRVKNLNIKGLY